MRVLDGLCILFVMTSFKASAGYWSENLDNWKKKTFEGSTQYEVVSLDGTECLKATAKESASGRYIEKEVDVTKTPFLNWSWKPIKQIAEHDEKTKEGDDFALRVYIVKSGGVAVWNTRALNYVHSSKHKVGEHWFNPFTDKAGMLVVSNNSNKEGWIPLKRNVREDYKKVFGEDLEVVDSVALMTDTDNMKTEASGCYGEISWSEK